LGLGKSTEYTEDLWRADWCGKKLEWQIKAPKARNVKSLGQRPRCSTLGFQALKARNRIINLALSVLDGFRTDTVSVEEPVGFFAN